MELPLAIQYRLKVIEVRCLQLRQIIHKIIGKKMHETLHEDIFNSGMHVQSKNPIKFLLLFYFIIVVPPLAM